MIVLVRERPADSEVRSFGNCKARRNDTGGPLKGLGKQGFGVCLERNFTRDLFRFRISQSWTRYDRVHSCSRKEKGFNFFFFFLRVGVLLPS